MQVQYITEDPEPEPATQEDLIREQKFKRMLDKNPDKICPEAIEHLLRSFEKNYINCSNMRRLVFEKMKKVKTIRILSEEERLQFGLIN